MKTYLVGGAVRDKLLGYPFHERDWVVVGATAEQLLAQGYQAVGKDFPVFLHPQTHEEYALARTERKTGPGYTGFDCFASPNVSLEEDLQRRDLTINAMAEDNEGNIIDPYHGQSDLANKILRHVSAAFTEDPLRVLRVARFCARYAHLGFHIAAETMHLMEHISSSSELQALPAERIWKELERSLHEKNPQQFFITLQDAHALQILMPELTQLAPNTYTALQQAAIQGKAVAIRFALLFIDVDRTSTDHFCQRLRSPKEFRELALLVSSYGRSSQDKFTNAEQLLTLLLQLDPFRRPQRFEQFLQCTETLFKNTHTQNQLRRAFCACNTINNSELSVSGLTGKAFAEALHQRRLHAIAKCLFSDDYSDN